MNHASGVISYGKLVRDRIPEIIAADGRVPRTRVLGASEYQDALLAKLGEETEELRTAPAAERIGELADLQEVLDAVAHSYGYSRAEIDAAAARKRERRGGFNDRIWLDSTAPAL